MKKKGINTISSRNLCLLRARVFVLITFYVHMYDLVQRLLNRFNKKKNRQIPVKFVPAAFQNPSSKIFALFFKKISAVSVLSVL